MHTVIQFKFKKSVDNSVIRSCQNMFPVAKTDQMTIWQAERRTWILNRHI